jgi:hypothetical protein
MVIMRKVIHGRSSANGRSQKRQGQAWPFSPLQPRGLTDSSRAVAGRTATRGGLDIPLILSLYPERGYRSSRTLTMPTSRMPESAIMWLERKDR